MVRNLTSIQTSSDGAWQGDNPLNFAFPLLIVQTIVVLVISRLLAFLLKPFRQPKVVAEILGGILLGPSALGRSKYFLDTVFPSWSTPILESVASIGLLFFLFLVGLELDLSSIRRTGKRAFGIAFAGISLPFAFAAGVTYVLRHVLVHTGPSPRAGYGQMLVFMGVSLSITAFPVLARILAELKLLTTQVGETAMAAAAFNDVVAWVLLALAIAITGHDGPGSGRASPVTPVWVLLSGIAFVGFMMAVVRPAMGFVSRKCSPEHDMADEVYIGLTLAGVMLSGFMTDLIGIHSIFGAFVFGLTIPKRGEFAGRLIKRIEDFVSALLLPLYFASSGLKTDVAKIQGAGAWGLLALVISTACAGKIVGTFAVAMVCMIPARESLALGVLMNTKGLVELIVLNIGREKKVLNDEMFAILVLMALFTTFMTTPTVMAIYKPTRVLSPRSDLQDPEEDGCVRIVSCVHGSGNITSIINLIDLIRGSKRPSSLKLYAVHLVELTDRSSSIVMVQRARRNGKPFVDRCIRQGKSRDQVVGNAFEAYAKGTQPPLDVRPTTAISNLHTMHEDICHVAKHKRASMIVLPFHKQWRGKGGEETGEMEDLGHGWRMVNQRVLHNAPCSVAVLVDRGFGGCSEGSQQGTEHDPTKRVCVLFFGGPDDRQALDLGGKISERLTVRVTVVHFFKRDGTAKNASTQHPLHGVCRQRSCIIKANEQEEDEGAIEEFKKRWSMTTEYTERFVENAIEEVIEIGRRGAYDLIVVGKGSSPSIGNSDRHNEYPEFGVVGGVLASSSHGITSSILVVQHHDDQAPASIMLEKCKAEIVAV